MQHLCAAACLLTFTGVAAAKPAAPSQDSAEKPRIIFFPARGVERGSAASENHLVAKATNLTYHGGPTLRSAKVVLIFWGPSFSNAASPDYIYAQTIISFRNQFGTTPEYNTITEYAGIQTADLGSGTADWFDTSTPPANVTDANAQAEVNRYLASHTFDANTIYEVVLPSTSYSTSPSGSTSCGGPALAYCAYHSWIGSGSTATKYSVQPYPSCGGCQVSGWTAVQNQEHFVTHETREAVTDPTGAGWYAGSLSNEADDQCAWSTFFGTGGYGYQYEWSNAAGGCIATRSTGGAVPATPWLTVTSEQCRGANSAEWSASNGATRYELWGSSSSTFSSSSLYYSGPGTLKIVNVGGTTYFHVRACNANGCSAFSNTRIATAISGCK